MNSTERILRQQSQSRVSIEKGIPLAKELKEGIPVIRDTKDGLYQYVKYNNVLFRVKLERV